MKKFECRNFEHWKNFALSIFLFFDIAVIVTILRPLHYRSFLVFFVGGIVNVTNFSTLLPYKIRIYGYFSLILRICSKKSFGNNDE